MLYIKPDFKLPNSSRPPCPHQGLSLAFRPANPDRVHIAGRAPRNRKPNRDHPETMVFMQLYEKTPHPSRLRFCAASFFFDFSYLARQVCQIGIIATVAVSEV